MCGSGTTASRPLPGETAPSHTRRAEPVRDNEGNGFVVAATSYSAPDTTVVLIGDASLSGTLTKIEYGQEVANAPIRNLGPAMAARVLAYGNIPGSL